MNDRWNRVGTIHQDQTINTTGGSFEEVKKQAAESMVFMARQREKIERLEAQLARHRWEPRHEEVITLILGGLLKANGGHLGFGESDLGEPSDRFVIEVDEELGIVTIDLIPDFVHVGVDESPVPDADLFDSHGAMHSGQPIGASQVTDAYFENVIKPLAVQFEANLASQLKQSRKAK